MICLFHPLIGVSPMFASGLAARQGLNIQGGSATFFANGSQPGGVLTAPGAISDDTATRLANFWNTNFTGANAGRIAVVGDGMKYETMTMSAADAQLIEQLKWTADVVCSTLPRPRLHDRDRPAAALREHGTAVAAVLRSVCSR